MKRKSDACLGGLNLSRGAARRTPSKNAATPQHLSKFMVFGVAATLWMNSRCATVSPACFASVAGTMRIIRNAPGLAPVGNRQMLRMLRQNFGV